MQTMKTFDKILSGNYRFLIPVVRVRPHNCAYLLHLASHFYATLNIVITTNRLVLLLPIGYNYV